MKRLIAKLIGSKDSPIGRDTAVHRVGEYSVVRKIGSGGTSDVYLGLHVDTMATAAIKHMSLKRSASAHQQMFATEAALCGKLDHPNIIGMHGSGVAESGSAYLVMEYIEGCSLDRHEHPDTLLPVEQVIKIMRQTAGALQYLAQEGVIHRDLKPGNILLRKDGLVKIADFGCAIVDGHTSEAMRIAGSLPYMSPEQISGKPLSRLADMYSLGAVFYRLLSGHNPIEGMESDSPETYARRILTRRPEPIATYREDVPDGLAAVIERMLCKRPEDRFESWPAFFTALSQSNIAAEVEGADEDDWLGFEFNRKWQDKPLDYTLSFGW